MPFITSSYLPFLFFVIFLFVYVRFATSTTSAIITDDVSFDQNYYNTWGFYHFSSINNGREVQLSIDNYSGSGFMSNHPYGSGFFGMKIKIPNKDSLGIITAFYLTSHQNNQPAGNHDELDFEFLGGHGMPYTLQTNVFSNDNGGREERVALWFDPTADFHTYQILWNQHHIVFYVDNIPIRVFENNTGIGVNYPSQAMSVVGSLWSDTTWAAHGQPINWTQAPFVAYFQGFNINGCLAYTNPSQCNSTEYWWNGPRHMQLDHTEIATYEKLVICYDFAANSILWRLYPSSTTRSESHLASSLALSSSMEEDRHAIRCIQAPLAWNFLLRTLLC